jgi:crotonobetainyl-CoA:carnitine CoA-transferase CaiB-like acyl-CoA transferase
VIPGVQVADLSGGSQQTVIAILMALIGRAASGKGRYLDVSMTDGSAWLMQLPRLELARGTPARRGDHVLSGRYACYNIYAAKDGRHVAVGALEPAFWTELCRLVGREDLIADQYAGDPRRGEVIEAMQSSLRQRTAEEWFALARDRDACLTPVRTLAEAMADVGVRD